MSRAYTVRITALTLGVSTKWIDNVLSHHSVPGVTQKRQGVERAVSDLGIRSLELVRLAIQELGASIPRAVQMARLVAESPDAALRTDSGVEVRFPIDAIDRRIRERLMDAIEATPHIRRGRPRKLG